MKRQPYPHPPHAVPLVLSLSKRPHLDPFLRSAALATLLQQLLFVRGVVPVASADLLRMAAEEARGDHGNDHHGESSSSPLNASGQQQELQQKVPAPTRRTRRRRVRSRSHLKMVQVGRDLGQLLSDVQSLFGCANPSDSPAGRGGTGNDTDIGDEGGATAAGRPALGWNVKAALITLGPSLRSPREQYLVRFHSPPPLPTSLEGVSSTSPGTMVPPPPPPPEMRARLENELSRRVVREYLRGTLDPAHAATFAARGGGVGGGSACRRAHVALCIGKVGGEVGRPTCKGQGGVADGDGGSRNPTDLLSPELSKRIVVQRNFALKVPKMISRKRGLHRPFVVFDLEASGDAAAATAAATASVDANDDAASFFGPADEWIALRKKIKGFRS